MPRLKSACMTTSYRRNDLLENIVDETAIVDVGDPLDDRELGFDLRSTYK